MPMTYTSLVAPKGTTGSIANWVGYTKLDLPTILDESQSLLYSMLRLRDMRTEWTFELAVGQSEAALPARFLDPAGAIYLSNYGIKVFGTIEANVKDRRFYDNTISGTLDNNPISTTAGSDVVTVAKSGHPFSQGSTIKIASVTAVGGLTLNGTFPVTGIVDDDHFQITAPNEATATATGGGALASYTGNVLTKAAPSGWAVWDAAIKFDTAMDISTTATLLYYRSPLLLSETNQSNWLTDRYPMMLRTACQAAAANFMKDDNEYTKAVNALQALIARAEQEGDLIYRGASFGTETPHGG